MSEASDKLDRDNKIWCRGFSAALRHLMEDPRNLAAAAHVGDIYGGLAAIEAQAWPPDPDAPKNCGGDA